MLGYPEYPNITETEVRADVAFTAISCNKEGKHAYSPEGEIPYRTSCDVLFTPALNLLHDNTNMSD